jgi:serine protease Do
MKHAAPVMIPPELAAIYQQPNNVISARWVASEILEHGKVCRRQLGISAVARRLPLSMVRHFDLLNDQAVQVLELTPDGVAERSGIRHGDWIVTINDRIISSVDDNHRLLSLMPAEIEVELVVIRKGQRLMLSIVWD